MAKVWVLDTDTKGTGAEMVPLEKVLEKPGPKAERIVSAIKPERRPAEEAEAEPSRPPRFKVVDAMTRQILTEDADTRTAVGVLEGLRSLVDASIYVWSPEADRWRRLSHREEKLLWGFRGGRSAESGDDPKVAPVHS
jgi:hypothetical protein